MPLLDTLLALGSGGSLLLLIFYGSTWLLRKSIQGAIAKDLESNKHVLSKELEQHKRELDLKFRQSLDLQDRRRKLYEDFAMQMEEIFGTDLDPKDLNLKTNKLFGLLALYAPDDVYRSVRQALEGIVQPKDVKPIVYMSMRKSLFGDGTTLGVYELSKHLEVKRVSPPGR